MSDHAPLKDVRTFAYRCGYCGHVFESVHKPIGRVRCPYCGTPGAKCLEGGDLTMGDKKGSE